jgi:hypothetical protein
MESRAVQVAQLVRVPRYVYRDDLILFDLQSSGLNDPATLDGYEAGKPVDQSVANEKRRRRSEVVRKLYMPVQYHNNASQRMQGSRHPSPTVRVSNDIVSKKGT